MATRVGNIRGPEGPPGPPGVGIPEVFIGTAPPDPRDDYLLWINPEGQGSGGGGGGLPGIAAMAAGTVTISLAGINNADATATFPQGRFTAPPIVAATAVAGEQFASAVVQVVSVSVTSCVLRMVRTANVTWTGPVNWVAVQPA